MTRDEILSFLKNHKAEIQSRFHVSRIGLFGSYAENRETAQSDIDIVVAMPSDFDLYYDLKEYLEESFHTPVDLGLEKSMRKLVQKRIESEVLYV